MNSAELIKKCENKLKNPFIKLEEISLSNENKVLEAFKKNRVALRHFTATTGYGYGDEGRDNLNRVYADVFKAERAIVSPNIVSGTHALTLGLFGILRPHDVMLSLTGEPYDTLRGVIGGEGNGSLKDFGVSAVYLPLKKNKMDLNAALKYIKRNKAVSMIYIQRSRGYEWRDAFSVSEIGEAISVLRAAGFSGCVFVDNCYGELVEKKEPTEVGADICCGSLIKNLGAGIAPTGGYIVGSEKYMQMVESRLTAPSIGCEVGSFAAGYRLFYEGLFFAPHVVKEALKGSMLIGAAMQELGYDTLPKIGKMPYDITRSVKFGDKDKLIAFIQSVQEVSPVDSFVTVLPWAMPGYDDEVIMAAGCFVQGSSIELSADAPVKPPYIGYIQGGLTYEHCKIALTAMLEKLMK